MLTNFVIKQKIKYFVEDEDCSDSHGHTEGKVIICAVKKYITFPFFLQVSRVRKRVIFIYYVD